MQLTIILAAFLALVAGTDVAGNQGLIASIMPQNLSVRDSLFLVIGSTLIVLALLRIGGLFLFRKLQNHMGQRRVWRLPARVDMLLRIVMIGVFGLQLTLAGWAHLITVKWNLGRFLLADEVCLLAPFLLMQAASWYLFYPANRFVREVVVSGQLAEGLATRPVWSRRQYLLFHFRHGLLIILAPLFLILIMKDGVNQIALRWPMGQLSFRGATMALEDLIIGLGAMGVFVLAPMILRRIWCTRTLPSGPLRQRLEGFCHALGLRYRDLLLWDTYSSVANAAVMGVVSPVRYVLLSDALIENMPDDHIEAVFGHEAGHVKHHHILYLAMFVMGSILVMSLILDQVGLWLVAAVSARYHWEEAQTCWLMVGLGGTMGLLWLYFFGVVSRRFEAQADVHAAVAIGHQWRVQQPAATGISSPDTLDAHGAAVTSAALRRIAMLNGIASETRSWRHASIHHRSLFLLYLAQKPGAYRRFQKRVALLKIIIILLIIAGMVGWWLSSGTAPSPMKNSDVGILV